MEMFLWNATILLTKAIFYAGFTSIATCVFWGHFRDINLRYYQQLFKFTTMALLLAVIASLIEFVAKTGAFSENGLQGALDPLMLEIMWDSPVGEVVFLRLVTCVIALPVVYVLLVKQFATFALRIALFGLLLVGLFSFTLTGHVSEKGIEDKTVLILHIAIMAWWFGSLVPLKLICTSFPVSQTQKLMSNFGKLASVLVTALILLGAYMAIEIFREWEPIFNTDYGITFLSKMGVVGVLLLIAARHKFVLVPKLLCAQRRQQLARSINYEIAVAGILLLITAALTSIVGPDFT